MRLHLPNWWVWIQFLCCAWSRLTLCDPIYCNPPGSSVLGDSPGENNGVGCHALLQGIFPTQGSNPGIKSRYPALKADSLPAEPQGKPKTTGVGSLSLCQRIFLTQESNCGLLHCRRILYQLNYQGSPSNVFNVSAILQKKNLLK